MRPRSQVPPDGLLLTDGLWLACEAGGVAVH